MLIPAPLFNIGDVVQHQNNDELFAVVGTYYDEDLRAHLFITDSNAKIFGVNGEFYKLSSDIGNITRAKF